MKYLFQKMLIGNKDPLTEEEWRGSKNWDQRCEYDSEEVAIRRLLQDADLARMIWPVRVITSEGKVLGYYDPELDTRLPGCRWRIIQRNAYHLWEAAGKPSGDGQEFWLQAERELKEHNGIQVLT